ncbi:MAG: 4Fe-4S ferredoxin [Bacteroidales bacterium]
MKRKIIKINEDLCNGCGVCIPGCHEGAIRIIDGKAKLISELLCDGLGDCIGNCPEGAITIEEREAETYSEKKKTETTAKQSGNTIKAPSQLRQWPIQLHLVSPNAPYIQGADVLLAADCTAFTMGSFHNDLMKGKSIIIACPKLDEHLEVYVDKIRTMIDEAKINSLTVAIMTVPCCGGLLKIAQNAVKASTREIPVKLVVINIQGEIEKETWA